MRNSRQILAILLIAAFALRLAAGWAWQSQLQGRLFGMGDSESYWRLGQSIALGKPYQYGSDEAKIFRTPGYPALLAPILRLAGDGRVGVLWARAEAALFGTLAVLGVWWLTRLLFDDRAAMLAAAFATFYPGAIVLSALVLSEAPFGPLLLLQLGLWILAWRATATGRLASCATAGLSSSAENTGGQATRGTRQFRPVGPLAFAAGIAAGAATLMRPSWLLFTPFAIGVAMLASPWQTRASVKHGQPARSGELFIRHAFLAFWMILGLVIAMTPWWLRNACVTGHFVPTTLQVGASLYDGLRPNANGGSDLESFVPRFTAEERRAALPGTPGREPFEMRLDRRMHDAAVVWARSNPGEAWRLAGVKFLRMWNVWPNEPRFSAWPVRLAVFFTYAPLLFFAIIGAVRTVGRGWPYLLCLLPAAYFTSLHVVFVSSIRYREPAMLVLLALAAGGCQGGLSLFSRARSTSAGSASNGS